jgi:glycosyltransferase involved in cell wall biosynthesis
VIPAYNEEAYLPRLLDTIDEARLRSGGVSESIELIVADNRSTDATAQIAADRGCIVVTVERRAIGAVRTSRQR